MALICAFEVNCFFGLCPIQLAQTNRETFAIISFEAYNNRVPLGELTQPKQTQLLLKMSECHENHENTLKTRLPRAMS